MKRLSTTAFLNSVPFQIKACFEGEPMQPKSFKKKHELILDLAYQSQEF